MDIKKIETQFFIDSASKSHVEFLEKERGYGIAVVELEKNLKFGIPLRSNLRYGNGYFTGDKKGLDFSKAILILDESYISTKSFTIPPDEYNKIQQKEFHIKKQFTKYIKTYIKGLKNEDQNILKKYQFSTLQNYKTELLQADDEQT